MQTNDPVITAMTLQCTLQLTYLCVCTSMMLLNMMSKLRGRTPACSGSPLTVYVLPELVMPYANRMPDERETGYNFADLFSLQCLRAYHSFQREGLILMASQHAQRLDFECFLVPILVWMCAWSRNGGRRCNVNWWCLCQHNGLI